MEEDVVRVASQDVGSGKGRDGDEASAAKKYARRNLYGISVGFVVTFSAFVGLQNLQSSINSKGGLGLVSTSILYIFFILAGFVSPGIIKIFGAKMSILGGFICHFAYILCNYYPSWYTLVPGSALVGVAAAPLWAAASSHLVLIAKEVAPAMNEEHSYLISKFTAIFYFIFQFSQLPGNLVSSLILFPYPASEDSNNTLSDYEFSGSIPMNETSRAVCGKLEPTTQMETKHLYSIFSAYALFVLVGLLIISFFVDRFATKESFVSSDRKFQAYLKQPFVELLTVLRHKHMLLIAPLSVANGAEMAFAFGSFTEVSYTGHYVMQLINLIHAHTHNYTGST